MEFFFFTIVVIAIILMGVIGGGYVVSKFYELNSKISIVYSELKIEQNKIRLETTALQSALGTILRAQQNERGNVEKIPEWEEITDPNIEWRE